jgi:hypothetical protein
VPTVLFHVLLLWGEKSRANLSVSS